MSNTQAIWKVLLDHFSASDSAQLWEIAIKTILADANQVFAETPARQGIVLQIGCCSRWLAPHAFRWSVKSGQFVAPAGYVGRGRFLRGIPELDWGSCFERTAIDHPWIPIKDVDQRSPLIRVAIPARTVSRIRASVHVLWQRGPKPHFTIARSYYGFRLSQSGWRHRAYVGPRIPKPDASTASPGPRLVPASKG